jgi:hypothetical protein|tara:strand:+ start:650 stop:799 length:150 start_codon:yes stop_codon:yes gene_type:complete
MGIVVGWVTKKVLTEKMIKSVLIMLGDYLVASSKNKLDDKVWDKVKKTL